jgi:hypothetical protein
LVNGLDCQRKLAVILGWEGQDPDLFGLHFNTVASFNLQHPGKSTDEALEQLRSIVIRALDSETPLDRLAKEMGRRFQGARRVLRAESDQHLVRHEWPMTVADVYNSGHSEGASYRVRRWATVVRSTI